MLLMVWRSAWVRGSRAVLDEGVRMPRRIRRGGVCEDILCVCKRERERKGEWTEEMK